VQRVIGLMEEVQLGSDVGWAEFERLVSFLRKRVPARRVGGWVSHVPSMQLRRSGS
jgi:hypothetical protein